MTTPETEAAITAAAQAIEDAALPLIGRDLGTIHRNKIVTAGLNAALPHIIQALANDAYQSRGLAACTAGDWLTERHADLLAPLDET